MTYSVKDLEAAFRQLPLKDRDFAASLIAKGRQYELTTKQALWVDKLTKIAKGEEPPEKTTMAAAYTNYLLNKILDDVLGQPIEGPIFVDYDHGRRDERERIRKGIMELLATEKIELPRRR